MPQNLGSQNDVAVTASTLPGSITALIKGILAWLSLLYTAATLPPSKAGAAANVHEPAANTAAVVTKAAGGAGISNVLGMVAWSYDDDPTAGSLIIADGASTVFKVDITSKGPGFFAFDPPLKGTANTALVVTLAAGGGSVSGIVSLHTWTE